MTKLKQRAKWIAFVSEYNVALMKDPFFGILQKKSVDLTKSLRLLKDVILKRYFNVQTYR